MGVEEESTMSSTPLEIKMLQNSIQYLLRPLTRFLRYPMSRLEKSTKPLAVDDDAFGWPGLR